MVQLGDPAIDRPPSKADQQILGRGVIRWALIFWLHPPDNPRNSTRRKFKNYFRNKWRWNGGFSCSGSGSALKESIVRKIKDFLWNYFKNQQIDRSCTCSFTKNLKFYERWLPLLGCFCSADHDHQVFLPILRYFWFWHKFKCQSHDAY